MTIGEKTGISTDAGDVRVVPDADTLGSTQLVHSVVHSLSLQQFSLKLMKTTRKGKTITILNIHRNYNGWKAVTM